ncbi:uncharacterized protein MYCFIDRAFT_176939 [Pseudocercospora fijiensis CIRAD86]|uniref:Uncharacterized protein n=1 Tax=Pseudocercospora fijiensis (strain CIRAD86) TaxID=383855 RepID=M3A5P1_PSEFD|nr:uncharacterized protein MYCFIDRAFT_176939 [Pseudocercospora fijiensis CIRAD86]EME79941.1 hypothetical protein MYCFIDRAFT_176939 [Pseudocercospora fijiensis CIRAD86]
MRSLLHYDKRSANMRGRGRSKSRRMPGADHCRRPAYHVSTFVLELILLCITHSCPQNRNKIDESRSNDMGPITEQQPNRVLTTAYACQHAIIRNRITTDSPPQLPLIGSAAANLDTAATARENLKISQK